MSAAEDDADAAERRRVRQKNKYSRQNAALGAETTKFLSKMRLLVVGMKGVGVELGKNCLLQGVGSLTIYDPTPVAVKDAGSNFFLSPEDVAKPRDVACRPRLAELNPDASVAVADAIDEDLVGSMTCVVFAGLRARDELVRWNKFCRGKGVSFIWALGCGLAASVFVDHHGELLVHDVDGEKPSVRIVESVEGDLLRYAVPDGVPATSLNTRSQYVVQDDAARAEPLVFEYSSREGDPANSMRLPADLDRAPKSGALLTERKRPVLFTFSSLAESLLGGGSSSFEVMTDYAFTEREKQVHASLVGVLEFEAAMGRPPRPNDEGDADQVLANAKHFAEACRVANRAAGDGVALEFCAGGLDETFVRAFARHAACELQPVATFIGGVAAQEVVKCAGKYSPVRGFAHFSFQEALPTPPPPLADRAPREDRYDDLVAVYGAHFVYEVLGNLEYFLVGSGALGCEFVKNFALCGISCGPRGKLTIADADRIELSNLTRQFLFREHNVGQPKSVAAATMAVDPGPRTCAPPMNPDLKVTPVEAFVGPTTETEGLFWDPFWERLDGVCNALDNMEARFYVDGQCVKFEKPLLESGTMGTSGNVDPIVPHKTRTYRQGGNAADQAGVPMCTLRNFPHLTDHCVEWARDKFAELFVSPARRARKFAADKKGTLRDLHAKVTKASGAADATAAANEAEALLATLKVASLNEATEKRQCCAQLAFNAFHAFFRDQILDLVAAYPANARVKDKDGRDKGAFWSGHKRFPTPAEFDPDLEHHWQFLVATTHLLSQMVGGQPRKAEGDDSYAANERDKRWARDLASRLSVPAYERKAVDAKEDGAAKDDNDGTTTLVESDDALLLRSETARCARALAELERIDLQPADDVQPEDFEKDDDYNFHVDFVAACANCRAANYAIAFTDHEKAKLTAGRIVPAIATTTAAVTGLVVLELFKIVLDMPNTSLRTRQIGLGANYYPSFDADNLVEHRTTETSTRPDPSTLPAEAFDDKGAIKGDYWIKETNVAYPDPHSVWTKLVAPEDAADWLPSQLAAWLADAHGLTLTAWNLACGTVQDEDGKKRPVSTRIYPPVEVVDASKIPDLTLTKPKAMMALQRAGLRGSSMMKYLAEWQKYKDQGQGLPSNLPPPEKSTADMSIREILQVKGNLDLKGRRRVLLDGLSCSMRNVEKNAADDPMDVDEVDVEKLAPVLIRLSPQVPLRNNNDDDDNGKNNH